MANFYKKWLEENKKTNNEALEINKTGRKDGETSASDTSLSTAASTSTISPSGPSSSAIVASTSTNATSHTSTANSSNVYENDIMRLIIEQSSFVRQKKFKLHDHLFHMTIQLKESANSPPLLQNILEFLQIAFEHILQNVRKLYNPEDHNIAFLTLYQKPMINGLNTGGFDIQESSSEMVQRVLTMLQQYLVSNQNLQLDETFKIYLKVLSVKHMAHKISAQQKKVSKRISTKKFGSRVKPIKKFNYFWALDVPNSFPSEPYSNVFKDMCLLTGTIIGLMQNSYFKTERRDKRFLYVQCINSVNKTKQNRAGKVLFEELTALLNSTGLESKGPYELELTMEKLSVLYKCQFFIFDGIQNSNKLTYMYPEEYQDNLIPIYFYQPLEEKNHLVYIRNLKSYFKANVKVCFSCKKTFLTHSYRHLCPKRKCCFGCRRFFLSEQTYLHEKLKVDFCDKLISKENNLICPTCNVTCYSTHCFKGHKQICKGQGTFGYKCLKCNKFTYRYSDQNTKILKEKHICEALKHCKYCREAQEPNHLCKLKKEICTQVWPKLAFITMEYFDNSSENCLDCETLRKDQQNILLCPSHQTNSENEDEPILALIYCEEEVGSGTFSKYEFQNFDDLTVTKSDKILSFPYSQMLSSDILKNSKSHKISQDFKTNIKNLQDKQKCDLLTDKLFQLISTWKNTTFICQDEDSICYVSKPAHLSLTGRKK